MNRDSRSDESCYAASASAIAACLLAAVASWWRGSRYMEGEASAVAGELR